LLPYKLPSSILRVPTAFENKINQKHVRITTSSHINTGVQLPPGLHYTIANIQHHSGVMVLKLLGIRLHTRRQWGWHTTKVQHTEWVSLQRFAL